MTATGSVPGRSVTRSRRFTGVLLLRDDGTFRAPGGLETCTTGTVDVPGEVGTARRGTRGRLFLEPDNLGDLLISLAACVGRPVVLKSYRAWAKFLPNGVQLRGTTRLAVRVRAGGQTLSIVAVSHYVGTRRSGLGTPAVSGPSGAYAVTMAESRARLTPGSD
jgi:hypothetical protein